MSQTHLNSSVGLLLSPPTEDSPPVGDDGHLEQGGHVEHPNEEGDGGDVELRAEEDEGGGQGARHRVQQELHRHGQHSCRGCRENISGTYCTSANVIKYSVL